MFICLSRTAWTPVSTALHTGPVHPGRGPGTDRDTDLHAGARTLTDTGGQVGVHGERALTTILRVLSSLLSVLISLSIVLRSLYTGVCGDDT